MVEVQSLDALAQRLLDDGGPWTVHSAFAQACNLRSADGHLLGIVAVAASNAPATLVIDPGQMTRPLTLLLAPGDPAHLTGSVLQIGRLRLDLNGAALWTPAPIKRTLARQEINRRLTRAAEIGASAAPAGGLAPLLREVLALASGRPGPSRSVGRQPDPVVDQARRQLISLLVAIREQRDSHLYWPARALSGFGPGLTPSGDDLLAGLALGLRASLGALPKPVASALWRAVEGRTTDLALARVRHAVAGHPDERVHRLLLPLVTDSDGALDHAVWSLLEYGHSSGADTLVGLLAGVMLGVGPGSLRDDES